MNGFGQKQKRELLYHVAVFPGIYVGKSSGVLVLQARRNLDLLSCEVLEYCGQRRITKTALRKDAGCVLKYFAAKYPSYGFVRLVID